MPKTTKSTRKPSAASVKKSGLKRRFDLTNKKVQFFVVIGIVAILGGGYFTYKSFAATQIIGSWSTGNDFSCVYIDNPITDPSGKVIQPLDVNKHCLKISEQDKQAINVIKFTAPGPANIEAKSIKQVDIVKGTSYKICIIAKASTTASLFGTLSSAKYPNAVQPYSAAIKTNDPYNYKRYCSEPVKALYSDKMNVSIIRQYTGTKSSTISVVEVEKVTQPSTPTPTPSPSK